MRNFMVVASMFTAVCAGACGVMSILSTDAALSIYCLEWTIVLLLGSVGMDIRIFYFKTVQEMNERELPTADKAR